MKKEINKRKYLLKGDYYEAYERISYELRKSYVDEDTLLDILEMLYRNQEIGKPIRKVIGEDYNEFIKSTIESYYSNYNSKKWCLKIIKTAMYSSIFIVMILYIALVVKIKSSSINIGIIAIMSIVMGACISSLDLMYRCKIRLLKRRFLMGIISAIGFFGIIISINNIENIYYYLNNVKIINYIAVPLIFIDVILCAIFIINDIKLKKES